MEASSDAGICLRRCNPDITPAMYVPCGRRSSYILSAPRLWRKVGKSSDTHQDRGSDAGERPGPDGGPLALESVRQPGPARSTHPPGHNFLFLLPDYVAAPLTSGQNVTLRTSCPEHTPQRVLLMSSNAYVLTIKKNKRKMLRFTLSHPKAPGTPYEEHTKP